MPKPTTQRKEGVSIYPSSDFLAQVDKLALTEKRKRAPMLLILAEKGYEAMRGKSK